MHVNIRGPLVQESPHTRTKVRLVEGRDRVSVQGRRGRRGPTVLDGQMNWSLLVQNPKRLWIGLGRCHPTDKACGEENRACGETVEKRTELAERLWRREQSLRRDCGLAWGGVRQTKLIYILLT